MFIEQLITLYKENINRKKKLPLVTIKDKYMLTFQAIITNHCVSSLHTLLSSCPINQALKTT